MDKYIRETFYEKNMHNELDPKLGSTANLNEDLVKRITHTKKFISDIEKARRKLHIPNLNEEDDYTEGEIEFGLKNYSFSDSIWFTANIVPYKDKLKEFDKKINEIIQAHRLTLNFREWLQDYILWGKPSYIPKYPLAYGREFFTSSLPQNMRLTTEEKRFYREKFREVFKVSKTGRIPKKLMPVYKKVNEYLEQDENTNAHRKQKNFDIGLKVLKKHGRTKEIYDYTITKTIKSKTTYDDLVERWHGRRELRNEIIIKKRAQNYRKIKQRTQDILDTKDKN